MYNITNYVISIPRQVGLVGSELKAETLQLASNLNPVGDMIGHVYTSVKSGCVDSIVDSATRDFVDSNFVTGILVLTAIPVLVGLSAFVYKYIACKTPTSTPHKTLKSDGLVDYNKGMKAFVSDLQNNADKIFIHSQFTFNLEKAHNEFLSDQRNAQYLSSPNIIGTRKTSAYDQAIMAIGASLWLRCAGKMVNDLVEEDDFSNVVENLIHEIGLSDSELKDKKAEFYKELREYGIETIKRLSTNSSIKISSTLRLVKTQDDEIKFEKIH